MADEPDPAAVAEAVAAFREEYEDADTALETLLAADADAETWTFDDVALDSGTFGELVSRGVVTSADGGYRVTSREGVRAALEDRPMSVDERTDASDSIRRFSVPVSVDARAVGALLGALCLLAAMRLLNYRSVFRGDRVVSPGNDPYYYRYWMERLLAESDGITDASVLTQMPDGAAELRPLTHATNWLLAELLGGDQWAADMVAAWLPLVATLALGVVVYWIAVVATDDVRVGVASVVLLALTPVHAVYSGVGFLEHRPHQYFWLGVTLLALVWLAVDLERRLERGDSPRTASRDHLRRPATWLAAVVLGIALGFSAHVWGGSILLFVPVAAYVGVKVVVDVRAGLAPSPSNAPLLVGLGVAGIVAASLHVRWGWHRPTTAVVPLLVAAGAAAAVGVGELWRRTSWPVGGIVALEAGVAALGIVAIRRFQPQDWTRLRARAGELFFREGATETRSVFTTDNAIVFEPMAQLGLTFYVALVALGWACWTAYRRYEPGWLALAVYGVYWLVLAALQVRFAAQLAIPFSVLGGLGLVSLLSWIDLARPPRPFRETDSSGRTDGRPDGRTAAADGGERARSIVVPGDLRTGLALLWIALLVCGLSLIFVPSLSAQTAHDAETVESAMVIDDHADRVDREYPENFVFSEWSENRLYNYFVSGEAERYSYAQERFGEFRTDDDPDAWYEEFEERGVGYVVVSDVDGEVPETSAQAQLHEHLGTGGPDGGPLQHYQAVHVTEETTAFAVVPGARIVVPDPGGDAGSTVSVETTTTVSGQTIAYEREVSTRSDEPVEVTVPYPGEYAVGDRTVTVSAADVETGQRVRPG